MERLKNLIDLSGNKLVFRVGRLYLGTKMSQGVSTGLSDLLEIFGHYLSVCMSVYVFARQARGPLPVRGLCVSVIMVPLDNLAFPVDRRLISIESEIMYTISNYLNNWFRFILELYYISQQVPQPWFTSN